MITMKSSPTPRGRFGVCLLLNLQPDDGEHCCCWRIESHHDTVHESRITTLFHLHWERTCSRGQGLRTNNYNYHTYISVVAGAVPLKYSNQSNSASHSVRCVSLVKTIATCRDTIPVREPSSGAPKVCIAGLVWFDSMWCDVMWCDLMWCDVIWCDMMWMGLLRLLLLLRW